MAATDVQTEELAAETATTTAQLEYRKNVRSSSNHIENEGMAICYSRDIIFLRASPGAASPLSSIAIRLTEHTGVFLALVPIILGIL